MVHDFKSKDFKHAQGNERRKESLIRKFEQKLSQNELIKNALSSSSIGNRKKILFDDCSEETDSKKDEKYNTGSYNSIIEEPSKVKLHLFDETDDGTNNEKYDIRIKSQFEGKKGYKLMSLQSNYNNDERFKLDERFCDDDSENDNHKSNFPGDACEGDDKMNIGNSELNDVGEEKIKQLRVLENVLGYPVQCERKTGKKSKKSFCEMVRFDENNDDHKRQNDQTIDEAIEEPRVKKKKKLGREERKEKKREEKQKEGVKSDATSIQKFYKVSDDLKIALKKSKKENTSFSLLAALSRNENNCDEHNETENEINFEIDRDYENNNEKINYNQKVVDEPKEEKILKVEGIKKEKIFFIEDDDRIKEGLNFINMKNSEEAKLALDNYEYARRDIREILRLRWQKHRQRMNPFKKKIGQSARRNSSFDKRKNNMFSGKIKIPKRK